jgi:hypothetical protein
MKSSLTEGFLLEGKEYSIEKFEIFEGIIDHVIEFHSLKNRELQPYSVEQVERFTGVQDSSAHMAAKRPFLHSIGSISSSIRTNRIRLPTLKNMLWALNNSVSF